MCSAKLETGGKDLSSDIRRFYEEDISEVVKKQSQRYAKQKLGSVQVLHITVQHPMGDQKILGFHSN